MTQIINLIGGPGSGKSTSAAYVYFLLKQAGINCELVREYVKDWAWEKRTISTFDQIYFLGKQVRRESLLLGKVDYIVTDCPVLIGSYYAQHYGPKILQEGIVGLTKAYYDHCRAEGYKHHNIVLDRSKVYNPAGRYQTEVEAKAVDVELRVLLENTFGYSYKTCGTSALQLSTMLSQITGEQFLIQSEKQELVQSIIEGIFGILGSENMEPSDVYAIVEKAFASI